MGLFSRKKQESAFELKGDPDGLTAYYMDTMMCNEFYLQNEECMQDYLSRRGTPISFITGSNRKLYRTCLDYLDQYKACIVGINQERVMSPRKHLSETDLLQKRAELKEKTGQQPSPHVEEKVSESKADAELMKF